MNCQSLSIAFSLQGYNQGMEALMQFVYQILGIHPNQKQIHAFQQYQELLISWSKHTNLTTIRDPEMITIKHFWILSHAYWLSVIRFSTGLLM